MTGSQEPVDTSIGVDTCLIFSCGCSKWLRVPKHLDECVLKIRSLDQTETFDMPAYRISLEPGVFIEHKGIRPDWALEVHEMVPFNYPAVVGMNRDVAHASFQKYLRAYGTECVPQCWIPDIMKGHGRFSDLWKPGVVQYGKLRLLQPLAPVPEIDWFGEGDK